MKIFAERSHEIPTTEQPNLPQDYSYSYFVQSCKGVIVVSKVKDLVLDASVPGYQFKRFVCGQLKLQCMNRGAQNNNNNIDRNSCNNNTNSNSDNEFSNNTPANCDNTRFRNNTGEIRSRLPKPYQHLRLLQMWHM